MHFVIMLSQQTRFVEMLEASRPAVSPIARRRELRTPTYRLDLRAQNSVSASARLRRLSNAPGVLQLHLPPPNGPVRDARLALDGLFILARLQCQLHSISLVFVVRLT